MESGGRRTQINISEYHPATGYLIISRTPDSFKETIEWRVEFWIYESRKEKLDTESASQIEPQELP